MKGRVSWGTEKASFLAIDWLALPARGKNRNANGKVPPGYKQFRKKREGKGRDEGGGGTGLGGGIGGEGGEKLQEKKNSAGN